MTHSSPEQFASMKNFLLAVVPYGIPNAVPGILFELATDLPGASQQYLKQTATACKIAKDRIQQAKDTIKKITVKSTGKQILSYYSDVFKILFGKAFVSLPVYTASAQPQLAAQLNGTADKDILRHAGGMAMAEWLQSIGRVRPKMAALEMMDMVLSSSDQGIDLQPIQLNYQNGDYWLGAEFPADFAPAADKLSVVLINPVRWKNTAVQQQAGLILDEWMEVIPNKFETTGIALNL